MTCRFTIAPIAKKPHFVSMNQSAAGEPLF